jgi:hypothetical protein
MIYAVYCKRLKELIVTIERQYRLQLYLRDALLFLRDYRIV